jgi:hypothetical protein
MSEKPKELLDLIDDTLILIFRYLDYHSQLDTMLVCRRFEALIGQNAQFYNKHKLVINRRHTALKTEWVPNRVTPKIVEFMYFGRYFGDVTLNDYTLSPGSQFFPAVRDTFETMGSRISKLSIAESLAYKEPFLDLLQLVNNLQELTINHVTIRQLTARLKYKAVDPKQCKFPELRTLKLIGILRLEIIRDAFNSVDSLRHLQLVDVELAEWPVYQQILAKQSDLRTLELDQVEIDKFEWDEWNLRKLSLKRVKFPRKEAFQDFVAFIRSLDVVTELELDIVEDQLKNRNNYSEVLTHLLNLPSLVKLNWMSPDISGLQIQNPAVRTFTVHPGLASYDQIFRAFPGIQKLEFSALRDKQYGRFEIKNDSLSAMSRLKGLREIQLGLGLICWDMIPKINCFLLEKLTIDCNLYFYHYLDDRSNGDWKSFIERHPNIQSLELNGTNGLGWNGIYIKYLASLRHLRTLKIRSLLETLGRSWNNEPIFNGMLVVKFIGETFVDLDYLELFVSEAIVGQAVQYLRSKFPQHGCDSRKFKKLSGGRGYEWIVKLQKI